MSDLFLKSVWFKDFRTFGKFEADLVPAPGLTLLVGTNGLGKSSFFDALEWGLTGEVRRFKGYMGATDEGRYLTRRGALSNSHEVKLSFSDGSILARKPDEEPSATDVIALLKKAAWTAPIHDIGTYLAFTHFLGQAAQQRFTSRERTEQWESLKGPSGIDRLDEVRNGLRGRGTERAFNRRIQRETEAVEEAARRLAEWAAWRTRLARLREGASATGALPSDEFETRLNKLAADASRHARISSDAESSGERLTVIRETLEAARRRADAALTTLGTLRNLPAEHAALTAAADPDSPAIMEARRIIAHEAATQSAALAATNAAQKQVDDAVSAVHRIEGELLRLDAVRVDLTDAARAEADVANLESQRQRLDDDIMRTQAQLQAVNEELTAIQSRAVQIAGIAASAQSLSELARLSAQLPELRAKAAASATAQAQAAEGAASAREQITSLTTARDRLTSDLQIARSAITATRRRATAVAAAVAAIASHLHEDDLDCPICRTRFERGDLRLLAEEAANSQDAALAAAEAQLAELDRQLNDVNQRLASAQAVLSRAEASGKTAEADAGAVKALEARLAAALPNASGDLAVSVAEAHQQILETLARAQAAAVRDNTRRAEATTQRDSLTSEVTRLEQQLATIRGWLQARSAAHKSALEKLAAARFSGSASELDVQLAALRTRHAEHMAARDSAETRMRQARDTEVAANLRRGEAEEALRRLMAAVEAAQASRAAIEGRWRNAGLAGVPDAATLENARSTVADTLSALGELTAEQSALSIAYEAQLRDRDLRDLIASMTRVGGERAADEPDLYEAELSAQHAATKAALEASQSAHQAVNAFAEKLRDETRKFSTQFLTPLNGLIDDFNEALLSSPGETVRLNAAYYKDRTQFDMGLHYRDPLDDSLYDTELPPQVVLSEGQLAANGFSILCAASTAYPWSRWRSLLMDDPLQHNDIIHVAAFVDLMRNLVELQRYQLIMSSHDRGEAEFIRRKFDAAGLPCSVIALTAPSRSGVRYLPPDHNSPARNVLAAALAQSA